MQCKNCNNALPNGAEFCEKCGTKVETLPVTEMTNAKYLYIGLIIVASIVHFLTYSFARSGDVVSNIAEIIGSFIPAILIAFLFSKFTNKKANKEQKLQTFTIVFCIIIALMVLGNVS